MHKISEQLNRQILIIFFISKKMPIYVGVSENWTIFSAPLLNLIHLDRLKSGGGHCVHDLRQYHAVSVIWRAEFVFCYRGPGLFDCCAALCWLSWIEWQINIASESILNIEAKANLYKSHKNISQIAHEIIVGCISIANRPTLSLPLIKWHRLSTFLRMNIQSKSTASLVETQKLSDLVSNRASPSPNIFFWLAIKYWQ